MDKVEVSPTHHLEVDLELFGADIIPHDCDCAKIHYISTHAFYNKENSKLYTKLLQKCNFDIELISWEQHKEGITNVQE